MRSRKILLSLLLLIIGVIGTTYYLSSNLNKKDDTTNEELQTDRKYAVSQSDIAAYGIKFGTFNQVSTSKGVYVNNASAYGHVVRAIGIGSKYYTYYYASWMSSQSIDDVTNFVVNNVQPGYPGARISAPASISDLFFDDSGRLYFRGWQSTGKWVPVYVTKTGLSISSTDSTIISKPSATVTTAVPSGGGTVTSSFQGLVGNTVSVTAYPSTGYRFSGWYTNSNYSGQAVTTSATYSFVLSGNTTLYARFTKLSYTITATSANTTMGRVTGGGTYEYQSSVLISATANKGYKFVRWSDGNTSALRSITVTSNQTLTATFTPITYTMEYALNGGTVSGVGSANYAATINIPNPVKTGYTFTGWTITGYDSSVAKAGTSSSNLSSISGNGTIKSTYFQNLTATDGGKITFTANYSINSYRVNVVSSNTTMGTVTGGGTYNYNTNVQITATPKDGYKFVGWYGNANYTGEPFSTVQNPSFYLGSTNVNFYALFQQEGIHVKQTYTNSDTLSQYNTLNLAIAQAMKTGETIYIDGKVGSLYQNYNTFVNNPRIFINYNSTKEITIKGINNAVIYNNVANAFLDVKSGKITFSNVTLYGTGQSKTYGNRDNALLRISGGEVVLGSGAILTNNYNIGSGIHYVPDWCPGVVDLYKGRLTMESGSEIKNNTTTYGGDVFIHGGELVMNGGRITSTNMGVYVHSGNIILKNNANADSIYLSKNAGIEISNLTVNNYVYVQDKMVPNITFGSTDTNASANHIITDNMGTKTACYYYRGKLVGTNELQFEKVDVAYTPSKLEQAILNASGKYEITIDETIGLSNALGKYVKHVSGCLSIGSVSITGEAVTNGTGKRTTITGKKVGEIKVTLHNVKTYRCYYYGTTTIDEVSITINVIPSIGNIVPSNESIAITKVNKDYVYKLLDENSNVIAETKPSLDTITGEYYVRFEYLNPSTTYQVQVSTVVDGKTYTKTEEVNTANESSLVMAIKNADGFYMNEGQSIKLTDVIGSYVYHLRYCINISDVKILDSNTSASLTGVGKNTVINGLAPTKVDISMKVKTNGWCAVYGTLNNFQDVTITIYVLPEVSITDVGTNYIALPSISKDNYYYYINNTWVSARNAQRLQGLESNTTYEISVGYMYDGEMIIKDYQVKTSMASDTTSLNNEKDKVLNEIDDYNLSTSTIESVKEIINKVPTTKENLELIESLTAKLENLDIIDNLDSTITKIIEEELKAITTSTPEEITKKLEELNNLETNVKNWISNLETATTIEDIEEEILNFSNLSEITKENLNENFKEALDKYKATINSKIEEANLSASDIVYFENQISNLTSMTPSEIEGKVEEINLVIEKVELMEEANLYAEKVLGDTTYLTDTLADTIKTATKEELANSYEEVLDAITNKGLNDFAKENGVTLSPDYDYEYNKITSNGDNTEFTYDSKVYPSYLDALEVAKRKDEEKTTKLILDNLKAKAEEIINGNTKLDEINKGKLIDHLNGVLTNTKNSINSDSDLNKVISNFKTQSELDSKKAEEIVTLLENNKTFIDSFEVTNNANASEVLKQYFASKEEEIVDNIINASKQEDINNYKNQNELLKNDLSLRKSTFVTLNEEASKITNQDLNNKLNISDILNKIIVNDSNMIPVNNLANYQSENLKTINLYQDINEKIDLLNQKYQNEVGTYFQEDLSRLLGEQIAILVNSTEENLETNYINADNLLSTLVNNDKNLVYANEYLNKTLKDISSLINETTYKYYETKLKAEFRDLVSNITTAENSNELLKTYITNIDAIKNDIPRLLQDRNIAVLSIQAEASTVNNNIGNLDKLSTTEINNYSDALVKLLEIRTEEINNSFENIATIENSTKTEINNIYQEALGKNLKREIADIYNDLIANEYLADETINDIKTNYQNSLLENDTEALTTIKTNLTGINEVLESKKQDLDSLIATKENLVIEINKLDNQKAKEESLKILEEVIKDNYQSIYLEDSNLDVNKTKLENFDSYLSDYSTNYTTIENLEGITDKTPYLDFITEEYIENIKDENLSVKVNDSLNHYNDLYNNQSTTIFSTETSDLINSYIDNNETMSYRDALISYKDILDSAKDDMINIIDSDSLIPTETKDKLKEELNHINSLADIIEVNTKYVDESNSYYKDSVSPDIIDSYLNEINALDFTNPVDKAHQTEILEVKATIESPFTTDIDKKDAINDYIVIKKEREELTTTINETKEAYEYYEEKGITVGLETELAKLDGSDLTEVLSAIASLDNFFKNTVFTDLESEVNDSYDNTIKAEGLAVINEAKASVNDNTTYEEICDTIVLTKVELENIISDYVQENKTELLELQKDSLDKINEFNQKYPYNSVSDSDTETRINNIFDLTNITPDNHENIQTIKSTITTGIAELLSNLEKEYAKNSLEEYAETKNVLDITDSLIKIDNSSNVSTDYTTELSNIDSTSKKDEALKIIDEYEEKYKDYGIESFDSLISTVKGNVTNESEIGKIDEIINNFVSSIESTTLEKEIVDQKLLENNQEIIDKINSLDYLSETDKKGFIDSLVNETSSNITIEDYETIVNNNSDILTDAVNKATENALITEQDKNIKFDELLSDLNSDLTKIDDLTNLTSDGLATDYKTEISSLITEFESVKDKDLSIINQKYNEIKTEISSIVSEATDINDNYEDELNKYQQDLITELENKIDKYENFDFTKVNLTEVDDSLSFTESLEKYDELNQKIDDIISLETAKLVNIEELTELSNNSINSVDNITNLPEDIKAEVKQELLDKYTETKNKINAEQEESKLGTIISDYKTDEQLIINEAKAVETTIENIKNNYQDIDKYYQDNFNGLTVDEATYKEELEDLYNNFLDNIETSNKSTYEDIINNYERDVKDLVALATTITGKESELNNSLSTVSSLIESNTTIDDEGKDEFRARVQELSNSIKALEVITDEALVTSESDKIKTAIEYLNNDVNNYELSKEIQKYKETLSSLVNVSNNQILVGIIPQENKEYFYSQYEDILEEINSSLNDYDNISGVEDLERINDAIVAKVDLLNKKAEALNEVYKKIADNQANFTELGMTTEIDTIFSNLYDEVIKVNKSDDIQSKVTAYEAELNQALENNFSEIITDLKSASDIETVGTLNEKLDTNLEVFSDILGIDKTDLQEEKLLEVIEYKVETDLYEDNYSKDKIELIKELIDISIEKGFKDYDYYDALESIRLTIDDKLDNDYKTNVNNLDYDQAKLDIDELKHYYEVYEDMLAAFDVERQYNYESDLINVVLEKEENVNFDQIIKSGEKELVDQTFEIVNKLNDLYNTALINNVSENEDYIKNKTLALIESEFIELKDYIINNTDTDTTYASNTNQILIDLYDEYQDDEKYNTYIKDEIVKELTNLETEFTNDILVNQAEDILPAHLELIDKYQRLEEKYSVIYSDDTFEDILENNVKNIVVANQKTVVELLDSGVFVEDDLKKAFETYSYNDLIYQELTSNSYKDSLTSEIRDIFEEKYENIAYSGVYYEENTEVAQNILNNYDEKIETSIESFDTLMDLYYDSVKEFNSILTARDEALAIIDSFINDLIGSTKYLEEDIKLAESYKEEYLENTLDNQLFYQVNQQLEIALSKLNQIESYNETESKRLEIELEELIENNAYYEAELESVKELYNKCIEEILEATAEEDQGETEVKRVTEAIDDLVNELYIAVENINTASEKGIIDLDTAFNNIDPIDYTNSDYSLIKNYYKEIKNNIENTVDFNTVTENLEDFNNYVLTFETIEDKSFIKIQSDGLDLLEEMKNDEYEDINQKIDEKIEEIKNIKAKDTSKEDLSAQIHDAVDEINNLYLEKALEDVSDIEGLIDLTDYTQENQELIKEEIKKAKEELNNAYDYKEIEQIVLDLEETIQNIPFEIDEVKKESEEIMDEYIKKYDDETLNQKLNDIKSEITSDTIDIETIKEKVLEAEKLIEEFEKEQELKEASNEIIEYINSYLETSDSELETTIDDLVNKYLENENALIEDITNYSDYELEKYINKAKEEVNAEFNNLYEINYSNTGYLELQETLEEVLKDLSNSTSTSEVDSIKQEGLDKINDVPTITEEETDILKENASSLLDQYLSENETINKIINDYKDEINLAETNEEIDEIVNIATNEVFKSMLSDYYNSIDSEDYTENNYSSITSIYDLYMSRLNYPNMAYSESKELYDKAIMEIDVIEKKLALLELTTELDRLLNDYLSQSESEEITKLIAEFNTNADKANTKEEINNYYNYAVNKIEEELLNESKNDFKEMLEEYVNNLVENSYTTDNYSKITDLLNNALTEIDNSSLIDNVEEIYNRTIEEINNVSTKLDDYKTVLEELKTDSETVNQMVDDLIQKLEDEVVYEDNVYKYNGEEYSTLEELISAVENSAVVEISNEINKEKIQGIIDEMVRREETLLDTKKLSEATENKVVELVNNAIKEIRKLDAKEETSVSEANSIKEELFKELDEVKGDNTYTEKGEIYKEDQNKEYASNHDFDKEGYFGNATIDQDALDLTVTLVIDKQKDSSYGIVYDAFNENKEEYEEQGIDLLKSEVKMFVDIYLLRNNVRYNLDGVTYTIKMLLPKEYRGTRELAVIYVDDSGNIAFHDATIVGNYIIFTTDHFSDYAVIGMTYLEQTREEQNELIDDVFYGLDSESYVHSDWVIIRNIYDQAKKEINGTSIEASEMISAIIKAQEEIGEIKTYLEITTEESLEEIDNVLITIDLDKYSNKDAAKIEAILDEAKSKINRSDDPEEIKVILSNALKDVDKVKTTGFYVLVISLSVIGLIGLAVLLAYLFVFKLVIYDNQNNLVLKKRSFVGTMIELSTLNLDKEGYNIAGFFSDSSNKEKIEAIKIPFGKKMCYIKYVKIVEKPVVSKKIEYIDLEKLAKENVKPVIVNTKTTRGKKESNNEALVKNKNNNTNTNKVRKPRAGNNLLKEDMEKLAIEFNLDIEYIDKIERKFREAINLDVIDDFYQDGEVVNLETLKEKKIINKKVNYIKILSGDTQKKLTYKANSYSRAGLETISKTKGKAILLKEK